MATINAINDTSSPFTVAAGDLTITSGNLIIPTTSSTVGQIVQDGTTIFHTYGGNATADPYTYNLFLGVDAGNFTMSTTTNFGGNYGIGYKSMTSINLASENFAMGYKTLNALTGTNPTEGLEAYRNVALGNFAGYQLTVGRMNLMIGYASGANYTTSEHDNICLNSNGVVGENNTLRIGTASGTSDGDGQLDNVYICGLYAPGTAVGATAKVPLIDSNDHLGGLAAGSLGDVLTQGATAPYWTAPSGGGIATLAGDSGTATGTTVTIAGTTNQIVTTAGTATVTLALTSSVTIANDLTLTSGKILLPTTSSTVGQIQINSNRVFHTYGSGNVFVGQVSGNFTLNTGHATYNTATGYNTLVALVGTNTTDGSKNCAFGAYVLQYVSSGKNNSVFGSSSGTALTTGKYNTMLGSSCGTAYTSSESSNIIVGYNIAGTISESNVLRIGNGSGTGDGQLNNAYVSGVYAPGTAIGGTAKVTLIDSADHIGGLAGSANTIFVGGTTPSFTATPQCTDLTLTGNLLLPTNTATVGQIKVNSVVFMHSAFTDNTFLGAGAGNTGITANAASNVGIGHLALSSIPNTAGGSNNTGCGAASLVNLTSGQKNSALGWDSGLKLTTGSYNTFLGSQTGGQSTALTGSFNVFIGDSSGGNYQGAESSNVLINSLGVVGESNVLRICDATGTGTQQIAKTFIAGIYGVTTTDTVAIPVLVSPLGQLGTVSSSLRYKENIADMGDVSSKLYDLRPVSFTWKERQNSAKSYGLIAEEVAEVFPWLVVLDKEGRPETVKYHELPTLLLNEIKKQKAEILELTQRLENLENHIMSRRLQ
jgi:Chaperone of endosialidase